MIFRLFTLQLGANTLYQINDRYLIGFSYSLSSSFIESPLFTGRVMSVRALPPALAEKARVELNENPERLNDDLQHLKDWIAKQPHLRARTDDQWLLIFLRGTKFSLERAKEKLDLYYSVKSIAPEMYNLQPGDKKFDEILSLGVMLILPKLISPDAPRVSILRPGRYNPDKYSVFDVVAVTKVLQTIIFMEDDNCTVAGSLGILDLEGASMSHFLQMTPTAMKKMTVSGQDATPIRMKGFHYINTPPGFETVYNAMKGLLNEKNRSRLHVHNKNYEALYKHIPKDILPNEYGGTGGSEQEIIDYWRAKVKEYSKFFEEEKQFGTDESKRPGKPKTAEEMFGAEGSFRKLEFD